MWKKLIPLTLFALMLSLAGTNMAFGVLTIDVRVSAGADDVEEDVLTGDIDVGSGDLEIPHDGNPGAGTLQIIGLRFRDLDIPAGAAIIKAYVQFHVEEMDQDRHIPPVSLIIGGELSPDAAEIADVIGNVSSRLLTTTSVVWDVTTWAVHQKAELTPDISHVIQEVVDQDGWAAGNAVVIIFRDNPDNPSQGTLEAESLEGNAVLAPLLHVEYEVNTATDPIPADGGVSGRAPLLQWTEGATAASHDVYLGTTPDLGPDELVGNVPYAAYWHLAGLTPGATYYWRVDEVEADGTRVHTGDLWSFTAVDVVAHSPSPPSGDKMVLPDVILNWGAGLTAASHDVYLGTDRAAVAAGTGDTFKGNQTVEAYNPVDLENGTTYYWRIDEVEADGATRHPGEVWSLKTRDDPTLIGWWKFDEGQGNIAYDSSGYGNHGFIGHEYGDSGPLWTIGVIGGGLALNVDGDDNYIGIDSIAPMMATFRFTFSIWIKTDVDTGRHMLFAGNTDSSNEFRFAIDAGNLWQDAGDADEIAYPPSVADNQWHMVTYVMNPPVSQIYVDGVLRGEDASDDEFHAQTRWSIGQEWDDSPSEEFVGVLDDARLWTRALTAEEIAELFKGDVDLAHSSQPATGTTPDAEHVPPISWSPGEGATQHDVYFGTDELSVDAADATDTTGIYRLRQNVTTYSPPEGLAWGTGPYYWRIDEIKADGTVSQGEVWTFSVADFLSVDNFESYNNIDPPDPDSHRIFESWSDGFGVPANGALVGYDPPQPAYVEQANVHSGAQAMPMFYNNTGAATYSEVTHTFAAQNWAGYGVQTLTLWFYGGLTNTPGQLYVKVNGVKINYTGDSASLGWPLWQAWNVDLASVTNLQSVTSVAIGIEGPGATGILLFDDIVALESATPEPPEEVYLEAEAAAPLGASWRSYTDPISSGGQHIGSEDGDGNDGDAAPGAEWIATYNFTVSGGTYTVVVRAQDIGDDSFWIRIPSAASQTHEDPDQPGTGWVLNDIGSAEGVWAWETVESDDHGDAVVSWTLPAGTHTLEIAKREDGVLLDSILITRDAD
jgi:hypothetical protein